MTYPATVRGGGIQIRVPSNYTAHPPARRAAAVWKTGPQGTPNQARPKGDQAAGAQRNFHLSVPFAPCRA